MLKDLPSIGAAGYASSGSVGEYVDCHGLFPNLRALVQF